MLVDVHAHIQFKAFKDDADEVIGRARDAGVKMVCPSSESKTSKRAIEYAERYPKDVWAAVGLHPIHLKPQEVDVKEDAALSYETYGDRFNTGKWRRLAEHPRVVAIGETGFDYDKRFVISSRDRDIQEEVYRQQIELALSLGKPIIQHCRSGFVDGVARDANDDALRVLGGYAPLGLRGVIHCYSGTMEQARRYLDLGFFLSFTGLITYNAQWDAVIRSAPLDRMMVETDCPYLTPEPVRSKPEQGLKGKRNEPVYVHYVAERIAGLKGAVFEDVATQTTANAREVFGID